MAELSSTVSLLTRGFGAPLRNQQIDEGFPGAAVAPHERLGTIDRRLEAALIAAWTTKLLMERCSRLAAAAISLCSFGVTRTPSGLRSGVEVAIYAFCMHFEYAVNVAV